jgi:hypothetical protein
MKPRGLVWAAGTGAGTGRKIGWSGHTSVPRDWAQRENQHAGQTNQLLYNKSGRIVTRISTCTSYFADLCLWRTDPVTTSITSVRKSRTRG